MPGRKIYIADRKPELGISLVDLVEIYAEQMKCSKQEAAKKQLDADNYRKWLLQSELDEHSID